MIVRSRAPTRIYFGGGGTDISPYTEEHGGCVLGTAINKYAYGTLVPRHDENISVISADYKRSLLFKDLNEMKFDGDLDLMKAIIKLIKPRKGFELFLRSDIPPNTGLGSSATAAAAIIGLFNHINKERKMNNHEIAEFAYRVENDELKNVGGRQDQYAAVFGGLNLIEFKGHDFVRVNPVRLKRDHMLELKKHLVLVYVGKRESSGLILESQKKSYSQAEKREILHSLKANTYDMCSALSHGDFEYFGKLINKAWETKVALNPEITLPRIESLRELALKSGAIGSRLMGAGRGGHMICYCYPNKEQVVAKKLEEAGARIIDFDFDKDGLQTWEVKNPDILR